MDHQGEWPLLVALFELQSLILHNTDMAYVVEKKHPNIARPPMSSVLRSFNLKDHRVMTFWLIELAGFLTYLLCTGLSVFLLGLPVIRNFQSRLIPSFRYQRLLNTSNKEGSEDSAALVAIDIWFAMSFMAAIDALFVVMSFNRALINRFHYAVSQRIMLLAFLLSLTMYQWSRRGTESMSWYALGHTVGICGFYFLSGYIMDRFERPMPSGDACFRRRTMQQYSEVVGMSNASWMKSVPMSLATGGFGLLLTMLIAPPWSFLVPIMLAIFEASLDETFPMIQNREY